MNPLAILIQKQVQKLLTFYKVNQLGTTVLVVTHDTKIVDRLQQRVIRLKAGNIISDTEGSIYEDETCEY